jgi:hypothetical protein
MKMFVMPAALLLVVGLVHGCKNDSSPGTTTAPPAPAGVVRAVCASVGLNVEAGTLVGGNECNQAFEFSSDETCEFAPVSQSFSGSCEALEQGCGAEFSTSSLGSLDFFPEFDSSTGGLSAVRVSGAVSGEFKGNLGSACGQTGNRVNSIATASIEIEVLDEPVTAKLNGTLNFDSAGLASPRFLLTSSNGFELRFPEAGLAISETFELQPGTYTFTLSLRANPQFNGGASAGDFDLSLRFE